MKIVFFTGKGGVGKSTIAAAVAWQLARSHRVRIVSLDPAHNLGDIFGVSLSHDSYRYSERLSLTEVDLAEHTRSYLRKEIVTLNETYHYLQPLHLDRYFTILKYSPGIEEYALLSGIEEEIARSADCNYLIFDTPPTALTLKFLALPRVTTTWLERLIHIRRLILRKRYTIRKIHGEPEADGPGDETVLRYDEGDDRVLNKLLVMHRAYTALNETLRGPDCSLVLVFNPDILSLRESERLIEGFRDLALPLRLFVHNKVGEGDPPYAEQVEGRLKGLCKDVPLERVPLSTAIQRGEGELFAIDKELVARF